MSSPTTEGVSGTKPGASSSSHNVAASLAYTLATSPSDWVSRRDLRATLGEGRVRPRPNGSGSHDVMSSRLRDALRQFSRAGWIERDEVAVRILDRGALYSFAMDHEG